MLTEAAKEIIKIVTNLSTENQNTILMYARVAHVAENSIKNSIHRALNEDDKVKSAIS